MHFYPGGWGGSEELPPGMPSATGRILCWLRAISSASVRAAEVDPLQSSGPLLFFDLLTWRKMLP